MRTHLQDALGTLDQVVDDFARALAFVDHTGNLSAQKRTLFEITVLCGLAKRTRAMAPSSSGLRPPPRSWHTRW